MFEVVYERKKILKDSPRQLLYSGRAMTGLPSKDVEWPRKRLGCVFVIV
jgi:hypothetical protein